MFNNHFKFNLKSLLLIIMVVFCAGLFAVNVGTASATDYYVSTSGNNSNDGLSLETAWATIQHAADTMVAGDTCRVQSGTYNEQVNIMTSGTATHRISYIGDGLPFIDGSGNTCGFKLDGADYITIDGFRIENASYNGIFLRGSSNNIIRNVTSENNSHVAMGTNTPECRNNIFEYNTLSSPGSAFAVMKLESGDKNTTIRYNNITSRGNLAVELYNEGFDNNYIYGNIITGSGIGIRVGFGGDYNEVYNNVISTKSWGIIVGSNTDTYNNEYNKIHHNIIRNAAYEGIRLAHSEGSGSAGDGAHNIAENNVVYNCAGPGIYSIGAEDITVRNNIVTNCGVGIQGDAEVTVSYNNVYGNTENYNGEFNTNSADNIEMDPLFADKSNGDFHLKSEHGRWDGSAWVTDSQTSPCIDTGNPSDDYSNEPSSNGDRINMGAYGNTIYASKSSGSVPDITPPTITSHSPSGTDVAVNTNITTTFSEAMNQTSAQNAFSIVPNVAGSFSWTGNQMISNPSSDLSNETTYTITISTSAEDIAGNNLQSPYTWNFTTVSVSEPDTTPPSTISNLSTTNPTSNSITLNWTASGDDEDTGTASSYDIRYSTSLITSANWNSSTQCTNEPTPQIAESSETFTATGLSLNTTYYFALKTLDEVPNTSDISNIVSRTTLETTYQYIWIEAENADSLTSDFEIVNDSSASNNQYIQIPEGVGFQNNNGQATYNISIDLLDNYVVWAKKISPTGNDNSFFVKIDEGTEYLWALFLFDNWQWDAVNHWGSGEEFDPEIDPVLFNLSSGNHTLKIIQREDGAKIDKILITNDLSYLPVEENHLPIGTLDTATQTQITGWAYDEDSNSNPINVHIYIDGNLAGSATANQSRPDLVSAGVCPNPNHGFSFPTPSLSIGEHTVNVYAINQPEGTNPELVGSPIVFNISNPDPDPSPDPDPDPTPTPSPTPTPTPDPTPLPSSTDYSEQTLLKTPDSFKIYIIINQKKKWISTPEVFETLGYQWTNITIIEKNQLTLIPDYEDNLIRAINDFKVYLIVNGIKRHLPNPEIFLNYGFAWNEVKDVNQETINQYIQCNLIKESKKEEVYYLCPERKIKRWLRSPEIFNSYPDNNWNNIQVISKYEMDHYPTSNLIKLNNSNDVYLIEGNKKRLINSVEEFEREGLDWGMVMGINFVEMNWFNL